MIKIPKYMHVIISKSVGERVRQLFSAYTTRSSHPFTNLSRALLSLFFFFYFISTHNYLLLLLLYVALHTLGLRDLSFYFRETISRRLDYNIKCQCVCVCEHKITRSLVLYIYNIYTFVRKRSG